MTFRSFMMIASAIAVVFRISFVCVPTLVEAVYGMQATPGEAVMGRYFGVTLLGLGLFCWAVKDVVEPASTQKILLATGVVDAIGTWCHCTPRSAARSTRSAGSTSFSISG